jgi:hypothetical protein
MAMLKKRVFVIVTLALLTWSILATGFAAFYYNQFSDISKVLQNVSVKVSILIDYGNGTLEWHNGTVLPAGITLLNATRAVANVKMDPEYASIVDSINNVENNQQTNQYWTVYYWDINAKEWKEVLQSISTLILQQGEMIEWLYQTY